MTIVGHHGEGMIQLGLKCHNESTFPFEINPIFVSVSIQELIYLPIVQVACWLCHSFPHWYQFLNEIKKEGSPCILLSLLVTPPPVTLPNHCQSQSPCATLERRDVQTVLSCLELGQRVSHAWTYLYSRYQENMLWLWIVISGIVCESCGLPSRFCIMRQNQCFSTFTRTG